MKKAVEISGRLLFPLKVGDRAVIRHGGDCIYTSRVVDILEEAQEYVRFETMNSIYRVSLMACPIRAALPDSLAMCA